MSIKKVYITNASVVSKFNSDGVDGVKKHFIESKKADSLNLEVGLPTSIYRMLFDNRKWSESLTNFEIRDLIKSHIENK